MLATQTRESVTLRILPSVTAKAATIASEAGGMTTVDVLERFLDKIEEADLSVFGGGKKEEPEDLEG